MDQIEGFILAGGASSRMGTDKSQLLIDDQRLIDRIAKALLTITSTVKIVGRDYDDSALMTVRDVYPSWGALGGLHAALHACHTEWALVVACDLPFISSELLATLASERKGSDAVVPIQPDGRPQPLCALYRIDPCLERATELIEGGKRRPLDLLETVRTRWLSFDHFAELDQSHNFFVNINTPEDYDEVTRKGTADES